MGVFEREPAQRSGGGTQTKGEETSCLAAETGEVSPLPPAVMGMTFRKARGRDRRPGWLCGL